MVGLVSPKIIHKKSPAFLRQPGFSVQCRTRWVAVVRRGFVTVALSDFSMVIIVSRIVVSLSRGGSTGVGTKLASDNSSCVML